MVVKSVLFLMPLVSHLKKWKCEKFNSSGMLPINMSFFTSEIWTSVWLTFKGVDGEIVSGLSLVQIVKTDTFLSFILFKLSRSVLALPSIEVGSLTPFNLSRSLRVRSSLSLYLRVVQETSVGFTTICLYAPGSRYCLQNNQFKLTLQQYNKFDWNPKLWKKYPLAVSL